MDYSGQYREKLCDAKDTNPLEVYADIIDQSIVYDASGAAIGSEISDAELAA